VIKKENSESDRSALMLSKSARDLKKKDIFKGVSQVPAMVDTEKSEGSPRVQIDQKALNKDLKGVSSGK
jgi:hypothetical protein